MPERTYFVTRHPGAVEWAERQGLAVDESLAHLDPSILAPGDRVLGTLPVHLAATVCEQGARYFHLSLDMPPEARGKELNADDLEACGARLEEFRVVPVKPQ
ncbi:MULTISPECIES: CRISPR-associated protein Csx16 [Thioalkalivibrio]|uniref:Putative CRISPR-associated protein n=1 Tax=Thioalkalivibrio halophilus TaxID=252474 RepID=A0A1V3A0I2_9GAMM|nr:MULTISPECIES: CRISPR-associated protein Csx16 [Thioalkalivibrio]OOC10829.1 putative CRISPR-associated protein [Thioalkalivibrio halophilus]